MSTPRARQLADRPELEAGEPEGESHAHAYADTGGGPRAIPLDEAIAFLRDPASVRASAGEAAPRLVWIDISRPGPKGAALLRDRMGFHPLAVEDSVRGRQRPKLDRYPGYFFLVFYAARLNAERNRVALNEVHLFIGPHYLVTVHDHKIGEFTELLDRWRERADQFHSVGTLAHAVLDAIVDDYFPMIDHYSERAERVEEAAYDRRVNGSTEDVLSLRRELTLFRKIVAPERDLVGTLLRRDIGALGAELAPYFEDVHDHLMRIVEEIDTLRELLVTAMEGYATAASNQFNVTLRIMASWSIILMAMTLVAGIYGMNFRFMPELGLRYGYAWALGLMLGIGITLYTYFRKRGWV